MVHGFRATAVNDEQCWRGRRKIRLEFRTEEEATKEKLWR